MYVSQQHTQIADSALLTGIDDFNGPTPDSCRVVTAANGPGRYTVVVDTISAGILPLCDVDYGQRPSNLVDHLCWNHHS